MAMTLSAFLAYFLGSSISLVCGINSFLGIPKDFKKITEDPAEGEYKAWNVVSGVTGIAKDIGGGIAGIGLPVTLWIQGDFNMPFYMGDISAALDGKVDKVNLGKSDKADLDKSKSKSKAKKSSPDLVSLTSVLTVDQIAYLRDNLERMMNAKLTADQMVYLRDNLERIMNAKDLADNNISSKG